jgi:hypothetical protein
MYKHLYRLLLAAALLTAGPAQAQYETGQRFISGNVNLAGNRWGENATISTGYGHSLGFSAGRFSRENRAVGWALYNSLSALKYKNYLPAVRPLGNLTVSISRFVEYHLPVGQQFSLFARPSVGASYQLQNSFSVANAPFVAGKWALSQQTQQHTYILDVSLSGGVLWKFAPKWALQGNFAGISPVSLRFSRRIEQQYGLVPNSQKDTYTQRRLGYTLQPNLNTGYVGLGVRYFYRD